MLKFGEQTMNVVFDNPEQLLTAKYCLKINTIIVGQN